MKHLYYHQERTTEDGTGESIADCVSTVDSETTA